LELIVDAISLQSVAAPDGSEELLNSHIGQPMSARSQPTLFEPAPSAEPNGLTYVEDAIDAATERTLASFVETLDVHPFAFRGFTGHRRTISFGWRYDFNGGGFARAESLPRELSQARSLVAEALGEQADAFEQCTVIEYAPGAAIGWHKDRPHFGKVTGLSLLAPCRLRFRRECADGGWDRRAVLLKRRSAYRLDGEAREAWQHSVPPLNALRYSLTFRTLSPIGASLVNR
jgi:alkylated DNA repair dioxygenase AlkB